MPYINIRVNQPLTQKTRQALQKSTTQLMDELMGKRREVTVVQVEESIPEHWSVNAEFLSISAPTAAYVDIQNHGGHQQRRGQKPDDPANHRHVA